jgi:putative transposase
VQKSGRESLPYVRSMARKPRLELAGGIFHVTIRGVRSLPIYHGDGDRRIFLWLLAEVVRSHGWACLQFVLMTNHYHLLLQTPRPNLALGMQRLNSQYAQGFDRRHGFQGHVFQRRYVSVHVATDDHLLQAFRYIALNPVKAGLAATPEEWLWSSYGASLGVSRAPRFVRVDWVVGHFSADLQRGRQLLKEFVAAGLEP